MPGHDDEYNHRHFNPMRLASFKVNGRSSYGAVTDGGIIDLARRLPKYQTVLDLFRNPVPAERSVTLAA